MIVLDTDHLTLLQWGGDAGERIRARLRILGFAHASPTTIISCEEQMRGWMSLIARTTKVADDVRLYAKLKLHIQYFGTLQILPFDEKAAMEFQRLKTARIRIGTLDLKIAAIALAQEATLYTRNFRDFRQVPGLQIYDASK